MPGVLFRPSAEQLVGYRVAHGVATREPAGGNPAGIALLKQATEIGRTFSEAATVHQTVALASHIGTTKGGGSVLDRQTPPLAAMLAAVSGMVSGADLDAALADASKKTTTPADGTLPHGGSPIIDISAKAGLGVTAGQAVQLSSGETVTLMSGGDTELEVCRFAHRNAVAAFPDIVGLCIFALVTEVSLEGDSRLNELLKAKNWTSGKLIDELVNLVDEQE